METVKIKIGDQNLPLDTNGRCFFCSKPAPVRLIIRPNNRESGSFPVQSLQCLSKYLKINNCAKQPGGEQGDSNEDDNDNNDGENVSKRPRHHHQLDKVRKSSNLKVELCEDCAPLNRKFAEVYQQLEKLSMEATFWLKLILVTLEKAWAEDIAAEFQPLTSPQYRTPEEVRLLREDVVEKSSTKLISLRTPQVYIENMTMDEVEEEKAKIKRDFPTATSHLKEKQVMMNSSSPLGYDSVLEGEDGNSSNGNSSDDDDELWEPPPDTEPIEYQGEMKSETSDEVKKVKGEKKGASRAKTPACKRVIIKTWNWKCTTDPKTGTTKCNDCSREFSRRRAFQDHYRKAHLQLQYQCPFCNQSFKDKHTYSYHRNSVHLGRKYKCMKCRILFPNKISYQEHRQQTSCGIREAREVVLRHKCNICGKGFATPKSLRLHMKGIHLKILDHPCRKCGKGFPAAHYLRIHLKKCKGATATTVAPVKREVEVTESVLNGEVDDDGNSNFDEEPPPSVAAAVEGDGDEVEGGAEGAVKTEADADGDTPIRIVTLERGIFPPKLKMRDKYTIDIDRGKFSCKLCPAEYPTQVGIFQHYKRGHLKLRYKCSDCDKIFVSRKHHIRHYDSAHIGIKFKCEKCGKLFKWEASLMEHLQKSKCREEGTPKPVGKHVCPECGKRFWRARELDAHVKRIHLNVWDHVCGQCGKGCSTKYSLAAHLQVAHSDKWEHECDKCEKKFKTKYALDYHRRVRHP